MTISVDLDHSIAPTDEDVKRTKKRMGKLLRRMRTATIRSDGRKMALRDIADKVGVSAVTISAAEAGTLSLTTFVLLYGFYRGHTDMLEFVDDLDSEVEGSYIPIDTLRAFADAVPLTTREFLHVVAHFPMQSYRVLYNAYKDLKSLGFALRCVIESKDATYYVATTEYAATRPEHENWVLPTELHQVAMTKASTQDREFTHWAQQVLIDAVQTRPEYAERFNL
jgi:hypothetical protein